MDNYLAIAIVAAALGLAGCAADPKAASIPSDATNSGTLVTGSRIPPKSAAARSVRSVSGEAWRRETTPVIGNQPLGN